MTDHPLLDIRDFSLVFDTFDGTYHAIDGVNLSLQPVSAWSRRRPHALLADPCNFRGVNFWACRIALCDRCAGVR